MDEFEFQLKNILEFDDIPEDLQMLSEEDLLLLKLTEEEEEE